MGGDWKRCKLGDLIEVKHGWAFKGANMVESLQDGPIVVAIGNFEYSGGFRFGNTKIKRYNNEFPKEYTLKPGDILLAMTCQTSGGEILGIPGKIPGDSNVYLHNQRLGKVILKDLANVSLEYLYWLFLSPIFNQHLYLTSTGTKILHTAPNKIASYEFSLPPLDEQKHIASILDSINDKIQLNRQMNTTLEAMAQALFKSWFVDFDPVIDNALAAGNPIPDPLHARAETRKALGDKRKPLPEAMQKQFPSRFVFSEEMGWIPEGWNIAEIGDYGLEIESGRRPKGGIDKELSLGIPSVGAESICPIGEFDFSKAKVVTQEFANNAKRGWVKNYDVALYKDGGKPGLFKPRVSLYGEGYPYKNFMVNEHVFLLRSKRLGQFFLYYSVTAQTFSDQIIAKGSAKAAQPGLNQGEVRDTKFLMASDGVILSFNNLIGRNVSKRFSLGKSSSTLTQLRDTLLPKLLSGQLRIPDAEKLVTDAL